MIGDLPDDAPFAPHSDVWSSWLLHGRHGGDALHEREVRAQVAPLVDRALDGAAIGPDGLLVDVGAGEGTLAWRAIERCGDRLRVVLADISAELIRVAATEAERRGVSSQCRFEVCSAEHLEGIGDGVADAVAMRAALAYVGDKARALSEFMRVLRPGGRLSMVEPMWQDDAMDTIALRRVVDDSNQDDPLTAPRLLHKWKSAQFPDRLEDMTRNPLFNFSERDLVEWVHDAGFADIHLELHIDVRRSDGIPWETFLASSPHPWAPSSGRVLADRFDERERAAFEALVRQSVETGTDHAVRRFLFLTARKPAFASTCLAK